MGLDEYGGVNFVQCHIDYLSSQSSKSKDGSGATLSQKISEVLCNDAECVKCS